MMNLTQQWARIAQVLYCPRCNGMIDTDVYLEMIQEDPDRTAITCDDCGHVVPLDDWTTSAEATTVCSSTPGA